MVQMEAVLFYIIAMNESYLSEQFLHLSSSKLAKPLFYVWRWCILGVLNFSTDDRLDGVILCLRGYTELCRYLPACFT